MTYATGSETRIAIVAETTPGTTPATPTMIVLPVVKFDMELKQDTYEDNSIFGDRMERTAIAGLRKTAGSFSANLSHLNFGPLIQTGMFNTFSSKVIKTGTALQTLTFEEWHSDVSIGRVFTGVFADKMAIKVPLNGVVTLDCTLAGFAMTTEVAALSATPTAPIVEQPFTHVNGTIKEGGVTIAYFTSIDVSIDNGAVAQNVLGAQTPVSYTAGMSKVTGTVTAWFPSTALLNKFLNQTATSIEFQLTDGTNTLDFNMPNVIYTGAKMPTQGQGAVTITLPFKALRDPTSGSNIVITES